jgi:hypothetical protein
MSGRSGSPKWHFEILRPLKKTSGACTTFSFLLYFISMPRPSGKG